MTKTARQYPTIKIREPEKPPFRVVFQNNENQAVGSLWIDETLRFEGNLEESAKVFFEFVVAMFDEHIKELQGGTMTNLKSLQEHEEEFWKYYRSPVLQGKCGIACPKCGEEVYADYSILLTSDPPQTPLFCKSCDWTGSKH